MGVLENATCLDLFRRKLKAKYSGFRCTDYLPVCAFLSLPKQLFIYLHLSWIQSHSSVLPPCIRHIHPYRLSDPRVRYNYLSCWFQNWAMQSLCWVENRNRSMQLCDKLLWMAQWLNIYPCKRISRFMYDTDILHSHGVNRSEKPSFRRQLISKESFSLLIFTKRNTVIKVLIHWPDFVRNIQSYISRHACTRYGFKVVIMNYIWCSSRFTWTAL